MEENTILDLVGGEFEKLEREDDETEKDEEYDDGQGRKYDILDEELYD